MKNESGFTPTGDLVLVLPSPVKDTTAGGIALADVSLAKEAKATRTGTILAMGAEAAESPRMKGIAVGDTVLFARYAADFLPVGGVEYFVMRATAIHGRMDRLPDYAIAAARSSIEVFPSTNVLTAA